jgi:hypothetical protein
MLLFDSISAVGKIEDYRDQNGKSANVIEQIEECPVAERPGNPSQRPVQASKRNYPACGDRLPLLTPGSRPVIVVEMAHSASAFPFVG